MLRFIRHGCLTIFTHKSDSAFSDSDVVPVKQSFFLFFLLCVRMLQAQEKSIQLPHVSVSAPKQTNHSDIDNWEKPDSTSHLSDNQNLNTNNRISSAIVLKNYGPSGISSISIRGTSPSHTVVSWKGMPVQNPMLGQSDASLIAGPMLSSATLKQGGTSTLAVSENFGGILQLGNPGKKENEIRMGSSAGSFGTFHQWGTLVRKLNRCRISASVWNQIAENNFIFYKDGIRTRQTHNRRNFKGIESSIEIPLCKNINLDVSIWSQASEREIAPTLFESNSEARQVDENHRFLAQSSGKTSFLVWKLSSGLSFDRLTYTDPKSGIVSDSRIHQNLNWFETSRQARNFSFKLEGMFASFAVESNAYSQKTSMNRFSSNGTVSYRFREIPLEIVSNLKTDHVQYNRNRASGFSLLPSFTGKWTDPIWGEYTAGWHRKNRFPTLNDLFWPLSGNADLLPESGYTGDLSWKKSQKLHNRLSLDCKINIYQSYVRNFIQWLPAGNFWTPSNVGNVRIQGMSLTPEFQYKHEKANLTLGYDIGICRSEFTANRFPGDDAKGKQLIYIPMLQSQINLSAQLKWMDLKLSVEQTGKRNTDPSGQHTLPAFTLLHARIGTHFPVTSVNRFNLFLEGRNLTNTTFQMVVGYPMPLRQFAIGMELQFNK